MLPAGVLGALEIISKHAEREGTREARIDKLSDMVNKIMREGYLGITTQSLEYPEGVESAIRVISRFINLPLTDFENKSDRAGEIWRWFFVASREF